MRIFFITISVIGSIVWGGSLGLFYFFSGWGDGATSRGVSANLLFPFVAFSVGTVGCFVEKNFLLPCGVLLTFILGIGSLFFGVAEGRKVFWIFSAVYGALWWGMFFVENHKRRSDAE
jgi:hypothetical protein